jgi:hypothetical protein
MKAEALSLQAVLELFFAAGPLRRDAALKSMAAALTGDESREPQDEPLFTLAEIGREVRKSPSRLHRLGIQENCGTRVGGRLMYKKSRVLEYLGSVQCAERVAELQEARRAKEAA